MEEARGDRRWRTWAIVLGAIGLVAIVLAVIVASQPAWVVTASARPTASKSQKPSVLPPSPSQPGAHATTAAQSAAPTPTKISVDPALVSDITTAQRVVDKFWSRHWADYFPGKYTSPKVVGTYDGSSRSRPSCGTDQLPADNALYCHPQDYVAWEIGLMVRGYRDGDSWPYLVIAHEWGHAIQARIGESLTLTADELQADCLAGATLFGAAADGDLVFESGDQKELAAALTGLADETSWTRSTDHGDPFERIGAFDQGRLYGLPACIPDLKPAPFGQSMVYANGISVSVRTAGYRELTPVSPSARPGRAAIFEITIHNGGTSPFDGLHLSKPTIRYGTQGLVGQLVNDTGSVLGPGSFGVLQPGDERSILVGAVVPENAGLSVKVTLPGPNSETDLSANFEGSLLPY